MTGFHPQSMRRADGGIIDERQKSVGQRISDFVGGFRPKAERQKPRPQTKHDVGTVPLGNGALSQAAESLKNTQKRRESAAGLADGDVVEADQFSQYLGGASPEARATGEQVNASAASSAIDAAQAQMAENDQLATQGVNQAIQAYQEPVFKAEYLKDGGAARGFNPKKFKGQGTGISDSIPAKLKEGSFVLPADSAEILGEAAENPAALGNIGAKGVDVQVSNGELGYTPEQIYQIGLETLRAASAKTHTPAELQAQGAPAGGLGQIPPPRGFVPAAQREQPQFKNGGKVCLADGGTSIDWDKKFRSINSTAPSNAAEAKAQTQSIINTQRDQQASIRDAAAKRNGTLAPTDNPAPPINGSITGDNRMKLPKSAHTTNTTTPALGFLPAEQRTNYGDTGNTVPNRSLNDIYNNMTQQHQEFMERNKGRGVAVAGNPTERDNATFDRWNAQSQLARKDLGRQFRQPLINQLQNASAIEYAAMNPNKPENVNNLTDIRAGRAALNAQQNAVVGQAQQQKAQEAGIGFKTAEDRRAEAELDLKQQTTASALEGQKYQNEQNKQALEQAKNLSAARRLLASGTGTPQQIAAANAYIQSMNPQQQSKQEWQFNPVNPKQIMDKFTGNVRDV